MGAVSPSLQEEKQAQRGQALAQGHPASERQPAWSPASRLGGPVPIPRAS